ncbi:MAG: hypothetical protein O7C75_19825 [Verrucomicrobia bacterium]|nr:hypothetical protein [Verrucomicrobiota bacterium]
MLLIVSILAVGGLAVCVADWRSGMLICVLVGFLSDVVRKVTPDQPVYFVVVVGVFVGAVAVGFIRQYGLVNVTNIRVLRGAVRVPLILFLIWLAFEAFVSLGRYGNFALVGIGLLSYLAPVPGFLIAYYYGLRVQSAVRFIKFYVICALLMLSGIFLSFSGFEAPLLEEVGSGVLIHVPGGVLESYPGFLRSTEGAAWHAAAAISLILVLAISGVVRWPRLVFVILVILLLSVGLMTGRRKMLMEVLIFAGIYGTLLFAYRREIGRMMVIGSIMAGVLGVVGALGVLDSSTAERQRFDVYVERGATVFGDADDRFAELGLGSIGWALDGYGFFGGGLGVASQGGQHFGGGADRYGGAGEGGLGKIVAELGVPGLVLVFWIVGALLFYLGRLIPEIARLDDPIVPFFLGVVAFLGANIPLFIVATQIFGDLFVLLILGWIFGFSMAISEVVLSVNARRRLGSSVNAKTSAYVG